MLFGQPGCRSCRLWNEVLSGLRVIREQSGHSTSPNKSDRTIMVPPRSPAVGNEPPAVFLSYSRSDRQFALRLAEDLKNAGMRLWLDQRDIIPGDQWDRAVENALTDCLCVVVILSPSSVNSRNVLDEVSFALEKSKQIVPVLYRDCEVPFRLRRIQHQDFRGDYARALKGLFRTLRLGQAAQPTATAALHTTRWKRVLAPFIASVRSWLIMCGTLTLVFVIFLVSWWLPHRKVGNVTRETSVVTDGPKPIPPAPEGQPRTPRSVDLISGEWHSEVFTDPEERPPNPQQYYFNFKAAGARLFGSVRVVEPPDRPTGIVYGIDNGTIVGNKISFEYFGSWWQNDGGSNQRRLKESFFGVVSSSRIDFTYQRESSAPIEFSAKRLVNRSTP